MRSDLTIDSDFAPPPLAVMGDMSQNFTSKNPNLHYQAHPGINGEILFILNVFVANCVDQESLVTKMAAI